MIKSERIARQQAEVAQAQIEIYKDVVENMQVGLCVWHLDNPEDDHRLRLVTANPVANKKLRSYFSGKIQKLKKNQNFSK
ncbi:MAG: hypothetical protein QNJ68_22075 [Microcoleaceae cyanobacterium MO_207.B10]|nr:hypothetical protein [Microcoleaceae cyanobacterium MO_207.B10]